MSLSIRIALALGAVGMAVACVMYFQSNGQEPAPSPEEYAQASEMDRPSEVDPQAPTRDQRVPGRSRSTDAFGLDSKGYSYVSETKAQSYSYRSGGADFVIRNHTMTPSSNESVAYEYTAAFSLFAVASQAEDIFFVLGESSSGEQIIQKWLHKLKKYQQVGAPPGYRLVRTEIFRGVTLGRIDHIGADPYGRFLLLIHTDLEGTHLSQMDLPSGSQVVELIDATLVDWLSGGARGPFPRLHVTQGMLWTIDLDAQPYGGDSILVSDVDGDGIFTDCALIDRSTMETFYPYEYPLPDVWVDNFIDHD